MTYKKDYNELLLHLLCMLVNDVLHFQRTLSRSRTSNLTRIEIKVSDLQNKVRELCPCLDFIIKTTELIKSTLLQFDPSTLESY